MVVEMSWWTGLAGTRQLVAYYPWSRSIHHEHTSGSHHPGPFVGVSQSQFSETLSIFGDKRTRNGSKNGEMAPRTRTGYPHIGPYAYSFCGVLLGRCFLRARYPCCRTSHPRLFGGVSQKSISNRPCQFLAINAHKVAPRPHQRLQDRTWDAPTKGLLWFRCPPMLGTRRT